MVNNLYGTSFADAEGGDRGLDPPALKNHKSIGFLYNTGPGSLKNHEATKPAIHVGPSSFAFLTI